VTGGAGLLVPSKSVAFWDCEKNRTENSDAAHLCYCQIAFILVKMPLIRVSVGVCLIRSGRNNINETAVCGVFHWGCDMKTIHFLAAQTALALLAFAQPANAAVITVNQTLDLTQPKSIPGPGFQGWQGSPGFNGGYSVDIAEGDTFDFTIDFLGNQSLTLLNASSLWAFSYADISSGVDATGTLSLLDAAGTAVLTSNSFNSIESSVHLGQFFNASSFTSGLPANLTFSGLRYTGIVNDYLESGVTTRNYNNPGFFLTADNVTISAGAVPEPATWAMMIMGFGLVGAGMRRRGVRVGIA
jgi:PEP-CTERM motif